MAVEKKSGLKYLFTYLKPSFLIFSGLIATVLGYLLTQKQLLVLGIILLLSGLLYFVIGFFLAFLFVSSMFATDKKIFTIHKEKKVMVHKIYAANIILVVIILFFLGFFMDVHKVTTPWKWVKLGYAGIVLLVGVLYIYLFRRRYSEL